jgi:hypothetical protein
MHFHKWSQAQGAAGYESVVLNPKLKLLDQMREVMRLKHYSIRTEQSYYDWLRRYVRFHQMSRDPRSGVTRRHHLDEANVNPSRRAC